MTPRLAGKVAFVTGAARGIGAAIARRLAADGGTRADLEAGADTDSAAAVGPEREIVEAFTERRHREDDTMQSE